MSTLNQFLSSPDTSALLFAEAILVLSRLFEIIAEASLKLDDGMIHALCNTKYNNEILAQIKEAQRSEETAIDYTEQMKKEAREKILIYCRDIVWRVGLLTAIASSVVTILAFISQMTKSGTSSWMLPLALVVLILTLVGTIAFLMKNQDPFSLRKPYSSRFLLKWIDGYSCGTISLFVINLVILSLSYLNFSPKP